MVISLHISSCNFAANEKLAGPCAADINGAVQLQYEASKTRKQRPSAMLFPELSIVAYLVLIF